MFFDDYDRFLETGTVFTARRRLNLRHEAIIGRNREQLKGARVLDIASHDGRWAFAALEAGAAHVTAIEARRDVVERARETFTHYGTPSTAYSLVCGDIFEVLPQVEDIDVVMCLGFFYHTYRHTELLHGIRRLDPTHLLLDTTVVKGDEPVLKLRRDIADRAGAAVLDRFAHGDRTLVLRPSLPAVRRMLRAYDFVVEDEVDWPDLVREHSEGGGRPARADRLGDYRRGQRVTLRARSRRRRDR